MAGVGTSTPDSRQLRLAPNVVEDPVRLKIRRLEAGHDGVEMNGRMKAHFVRGLNELAECLLPAEALFDGKIRWPSSIVAFGVPPDALPVDALDARFFQAEKVFFSLRKAHAASEKQFPGFGTAPIDDDPLLLKTVEELHRVGRLLVSALRRLSGTVFECRLLDVLGDMAAQAVARSEDDVGARQDRLDANLTSRPVHSIAPMLAEHGVQTDGGAAISVGGNGAVGILRPICSYRNPAAASAECRADRHGGQEFPTLLFPVDQESVG